VDTLPGPSDGRTALPSPCTVLCNPTSPVTLTPRNCARPLLFHEQPPFSFSSARVMTEYFLVYRRPPNPPFPGNTHLVLPFAALGFQYPYSLSRPVFRVSGLLLSFPFSPSDNMTNCSNSYPSPPFSQDAALPRRFFFYFRHACSMSLDPRRASPIDGYGTSKYVFF